MQHDYFFLIKPIRSLFSGVFFAVEQIKVQNNHETVVLRRIPFKVRGILAKIIY